MNTWLDRVVGELERETGVPRDRFVLTQEDQDLLLELAGFAAHDSGARTNAPLLCYIAGIAVGEGSDLKTLAAALQRPRSDY